MMVANSFDLWQKDAFFSAAEEVQESADIMQSAYRLWASKKREGRRQGELDELCKELQAALSTAKWQLEEFEKAVRMSHGLHHDEARTTRHNQFVAAIEDQISYIEAALVESFSGEGKQPFQWMNLNKQECDDLAMFISGVSQTPQSSNIVNVKSGPSVKTSLAKDSNGRNEAEKSNSSDCLIDIEDKETHSPGTVDYRIPTPPDRTAGARRTCSIPNFGALRIVIPGEEEEEERNVLVSSIVEATPKVKGSKPPFWMQRIREYPHANNAIKLFNQLRGRIGGFQRQLEIPIRLPFNRSIQLTVDANDFLYVAICSVFNLRNLTVA